MLEKPIERAVQMEARGEGRNLLADLLELRQIDSGMPAPRLIAVAGALEAGPASVEPIGLVGAIALRRLQLHVEAMPPIGFHFFHLASGDDAFANQLLAVNLQR